MFGRCWEGFWKNIAELKHGFYADALDIEGIKEWGGNPQHRGKMPEVQNAEHGKLVAIS
jgi:hypothetical protein